MYVLSWIFLGAAIGTLAYGLSQPGLTFIYVSIGASVVAMLFLVAGVLRKKPVQPATAGAPYGPPPEEAAVRTSEATAVTTAPAPARRKAAATRAEPAAAEGDGEAAAAAPTTTAKKTTAKKTTAKKTAAKTTAKKTTAKKTTAKKTTTRATGARVVAIPERGTYHQSTCRFVKGRRDTEKLTSSTAKRRGYSACGVCKPDQAA